MGLVLQELQLLGAAEERGRIQENPRCSLWVSPFLTQSISQPHLSRVFKDVAFYTADNVKIDGWSGSHPQTFPPVHQVAIIHGKKGIDPRGC